MAPVARLIVPGAVDLDSQQEAECSQRRLSPARGERGRRLRRPPSQPWARQRRLDGRKQPELMLPLGGAGSVLAQYGGRLDGTTEDR